MMMTRFVQLLVLFVATADACEVAKVGKELTDKCSGKEAQDKAVKCATDAGTDVCAALKCSMDAAECGMKVYDDMGCCDDASMKAAMEAAEKAFNSAMSNEAYKDCKDIKYPPCGGGGDAGGATSTTMSAFALLAVMVAKMF